MRKNLTVFCLVLTLLMLLNSCYNTDGPDNSSAKDYEETSSEEIEIGQIISQGNYYVVFRGKYSEDWMHYYKILDVNGETVKVVQTWMDEAKITEMEGGLLKISVQTGLNDASVKTSYYDVSTTRSSPDRYYVLAEKNELVAVVEDGSVVIKGMFNDRSVKTLTIPEFSEESVLSASFNETGTSIDITVDGKTQSYEIK